MWQRRSATQSLFEGPLGIAAGIGKAIVLLTRARRFGTLRSRL